MSTEPTPTEKEPAGSGRAGSRGDAASPWDTERRRAGQDSAGRTPSSAASQTVRGSSADQTAAAARPSGASTESTRTTDRPKTTGPAAGTDRSAAQRSGAPGNDATTKTKRRGRPKGSAAGKDADTARRRSEDGAAHDWTPFRLVIALYGALIIAYGVWQVLGGTGTLPGESQGSSPTVASSYAGLAAVLCGVGAAFIGIAVKFQWANTLGFVCFTVFLAGIGRILAWAFFGLPHYSMIIIMVLDLVIPPCLLVWYGWINKANRIRREMAADLPAAR